MVAGVAIVGAVIWPFLPLMVAGIAAATEFEGAAVLAGALFSYGANSEVINEALDEAADEIGTEAKSIDSGTTPKPIACFVAGTLVVMANGATKAIERLKAGDRVLSRDGRTKRTVHHRVLRVTKRLVSATRQLTFSSGLSVTTTDEHPFYVNHVRFRPAKALGIGTSIVTRAGPPVTLLSNRVHPGNVFVYNLTVAGTHTYFVGNGNSAVWVHNCDAEKLIKVSRWGQPGLEPGDWVMKGSANRWNYLWTGKIQPGLGNEYAPFSSGTEYFVPKSSVQPPTGSGFDGRFKVFFNQWKYNP